MSNTTTPMNFRVPADLKYEFERTCQSLNLSMTSQLIFMMLAFVGSEAARLRELTDHGEPLAFFSSNRGEN